MNVTQDVFTRCPGCDQRVRVSTARLERDLRCGGCQAVFQVRTREGRVQTRLAPSRRRRGERGRVTPPRSARRPVQEVDVFAAVASSKDASTSALWVLGPSTLRLLTWKPSDLESLPEGDASALVERVARVASEDRELPYRSVSRVTLGFHGEVVVEGSGGIELQAPAENPEAVFRALGSRLTNFEQAEVPVPRFDAVLVPCLLAAIALFVGGVLYAVSLSATPLRLRRGLYGLVMAVVEVLGPTGILLASGAVLGLCALVAIPRLVSPPTTLAWVRAPRRVSAPRPGAARPGPGRFARPCPR